MDKIPKKLRLILRQNLQTLMEANEPLNGQSALKRRTGVAQATIGRILGELGENARIETVEKLAAAFNLKAWQLLIPGLTPSNPPTLGAATEEEKALYERLRAACDDINKLKK